jgi:hypothetical protein
MEDQKQNREISQKIGVYRIRSDINVSTARPTPATQQALCHLAGRCQASPIGTNFREFIVEKYLGVSMPLTLTGTASENSAGTEPCVTDVV